MNFAWCLVSKVLCRMSLLQMQCSDCSFSRAGKCTSTAKAFLLLNTRQKRICLPTLYFKTENPNLEKENTRKTTLERQCLNWSINFKCEKQTCWVSTQSSSWHLSGCRTENQISFPIPANQNFCNLPACHFLVYISWYRSSTFGETWMANLESEMWYYLQNRRACRSQEFVGAHIPTLFLSSTPTPEILYQPD